MSNNNNNHSSLLSLWNLKIMKDTPRLLSFHLRMLPYVGGDGLVVPCWLALCWIAQGSGFESQRGHLFFGISPRGEISQEGFVQGLVSPPATSRCIGSVRIISEAPLVCPNGCWYLLKDGGLVFHNLRLHKDNKLE
jgi:hypothetical protein